MNTETNYECIGFFVPKCLWFMDSPFAIPPEKGPLPIPRTVPDFSSIKQFRYQHEVGRGIYANYRCDGLVMLQIPSNSLQFKAPRLSDWFNVSAIEPYFQERLNLLNAVCISLKHAVSSAMEMSLELGFPNPTNLVKGIPTPQGFHLKPAIEAVDRFLQWDSAPSLPTRLEFQKYEDANWSHSPIVREETLERLAEVMKKALERSDSRLINYLALLNRSVSLIEMQDITQALVAIWPVIEALVGDLWDIESVRFNATTEKRDDSKSLGAKRRKFIMPERRKLTVAAQATTLAELGALPGALFASLNLCRRARNDFMHGLNVPSSDISGNAVRLCVDLLKLVYELRLQVSPRISFGA